MAPRSWPSSPGFAIRTLIGSFAHARMIAPGRSRRPCTDRAPAHPPSLFAQHPAHERRPAVRPVLERHPPGRRGLDDRVDGPAASLRAGSSRLQAWRGTAASRPEGRIGRSRRGSGAPSGPTTTHSAGSKAYVPLPPSELLPHLEEHVAGARRDQAGIARNLGHPVDQHGHRPAVGRQDRRLAEAPASRSSGWRPEPRSELGCSARTQRHRRGPGRRTEPRATLRARGRTSTATRPSPDPISQPIVPRYVNPAGGSTWVARSRPGIQVVSGTRPSARPA